MEAIQKKLRITGLEPVPYFQGQPPQGCASTIPPNPLKRPFFSALSTKRVHLAYIVYWIFYIDTECLIPSSF